MWRNVPGGGDLGVAGGPHPATELRERGLGQGLPARELSDGGRLESAIDPGSENLTISWIPVACSSAAKILGVLEG